MRAKRDIRVRLKPCPWCKKTPEISMPLGEGTWQWAVACETETCQMKPKSPHVSIRNTAKESIEKVAEKLAILAERWNSGNDCVAFEYKIVDTGPIMAQFKEKSGCSDAYLSMLHREYENSRRVLDEKFKQDAERVKTVNFTMPYRYF